MIISKMTQLSVLILLSCKKDPIPAPTKLVCGTNGWPQGNWKVKCIVAGISNPDSVSFDINGGQTQFGTYYLKRFSNPNLPLSNSTQFCGDYGSDINIRIYNTDTTKIFTCSIYTNGNLIVQKTTSWNNHYSVSGQCK